MVKMLQILGLLYNMLFYFSGISVSTAAEAVYPRNAAGIDNEQLELNCTFLDGEGNVRGTEWGFYPIGSTGRQILYRGKLLFK